MDRNALLKAVASLSEEKRTEMLRLLTDGMVDGSLPDVSPEAIIDLGMTLMLGRPPRRSRVPKPRVKRGIGSY